jgi:dTDP-4-amino-4,6-dideoxygalactose transaminase
VIQCDDRDGLQNYLSKHSIGTGLHYPVPLHMQPAYNYLGYQQGDFPVAEKAAGRILSLPMYPELTENQIRYVCEKIKAYARRNQQHCLRC